MRWVPALGVAVALFTFVAQIPYNEQIRTANSRINNFGAPAALVGADARPGDGVLFFDSLYRMVELTYPHDFRNVTDIALATSPQASNTILGRNLPYAAARDRILGYDRIWAIGLPPRLRPLDPVSLRELALLRHNFTRVSLHKFKGVDVMLWVRRTDAALRTPKHPHQPAGLLPATRRRIAESPAWLSEYQSVLRVGAARRG